MTIVEAIRGTYKLYGRAVNNSISRIMYCILLMNGTLKIMQFSIIPHLHIFLSTKKYREQISMALYFKTLHAPFGYFASAKTPLLSRVYQFTSTGYAIKIIYLGLSSAVTMYKVMPICTPCKASQLQ